MVFKYLARAESIAVTQFQWNRSPKGLEVLLSTLCLIYLSGGSPEPPSTQHRDIGVTAAWQLSLWMHLFPLGVRGREHPAVAVWFWWLPLQRRKVLSRMLSNLQPKPAFPPPVFLGGWLLLSLPSNSQEKEVKNSGDTEYIIRVVYGKVH